MWGCRWHPSLRPQRVSDRSVPAGLSQAGVNAEEAQIVYKRALSNWFLVLNWHDVEPGPIKCFLLPREAAGSWRCDRKLDDFENLRRTSVDFYLPVDVTSWHL